MEAYISTIDMHKKNKPLNLKTTKQQFNLYQMMSS